MRKSAAWLVKVWSQPRTWPGGHHAPTYGWSASVTSRRVKPAAGSVHTDSSFNRSRSKASAPSDP